MMRLQHFFVVIVVATALSACSKVQHDDLNAFMAEKKARPAGQIDPIPTFTPYRPFDYSATMLRAPFDRPVAAKDLIEVVPQSNVKPDENRAKEILEQYNLESLRMVGTIEQKGQLWALLDDAQGNIHYVKEGNYLGRNHGKITKLSPSYIQIVEIVTAGSSGGWVERPRTLELREK